MKSLCTLYLLVYKSFTILTLVLINLSMLKKRCRNFFEILAEKFSVSLMQPLAANLGGEGAA